MKRFLQIFFGGAGWLFCFFPIVLGGIFNLGTLAGLLLFGGLFLWGVFRPKILKALPELRKKKALRLLTNTFCVLFAVGLAGAAVISGLMINAIRTEPAENATVVVLGCLVKDGRPSKTLLTRINAAKEYLETHPDAKCVLSGGQGDDEAMSEAECMYTELVKAGIEEERLFIEDQSTSTRENLAFTSELIKENGLSEEIAIVTNEYHEYRAGLIAKKLGISFGAVPAASSPGLLPVYWIRELFGAVYEWVF